MEQSWYSYKCKSWGTLFFYNAMTGEHRWTNDSQTVHCSRASLHEIPPAAGNNVSEIKPGQAIPSQLQFGSKNIAIEPEQYCMVRSTVCKTVRNVGTETDLPCVKLKQLTRTVGTQTCSTGLSQHGIQANRELPTAGSQANDSTCTVTEFNEILSSIKREQVDTLLKECKETFENSSCTTTDLNATRKRDPDLEAESYGACTATVRRKGEFPFESPHFPDSPASPMRREPGEHLECAASHPSLIDNLFAMDFCFSPEEIKTEKNTAQDCCLQQARASHGGNREITQLEIHSSSPLPLTHTNIGSSSPHALENTLDLNEFSIKIEKENSFESDNARESVLSSPVAVEQSKLDSWESHQPHGNHEAGITTCSPADIEAVKTERDDKLESLDTVLRDACAMELTDENVVVETAIKREVIAHQSTDYTCSIADLLPGDGKANAFKCPVCQKVFVNSYRFERHYMIHSGEKPHVCVNCNKTFRSAGCLRKHVRTHTGEKPFRCTQCDRAFSQSQNLGKHMNTHTGNKPHKCNVCAKAFAQHSHLARHVLIHTGEKPYKCTECGRAFRTSSHLSRHIKGKHKRVNKTNKSHVQNVGKP